MILVIENKLQKLINRFLYFAVVLTNACEDWIIDKIDGQTLNAGEYVGWGTGAGTIAKNNTTLFNESSEARISATRTQPRSDQIQWVSMHTANATKTITEAGLFTAITAGNLLIHGDFVGIGVNSGDKVEFTIILEIQ
ncbi:MAG: hypothetical protein WCG01_02415 [bacterium]